jgi:hypothetical protein
MITVLIPAMLATMMPPWPRGAAHDCHEFLGSRSSSNRQDSDPDECLREPKRVCYHTHAVRQDVASNRKEYHPDEKLTEMVDKGTRGRLPLGRSSCGGGLLVIKKSWRF